MHGGCAITRAAGGARGLARSSVRIGVVAAGYVQVTTFPSYWWEPWAMVGSVVGATYLMVSDVKSDISNAETRADKRAAEDRAAAEKRAVEDRAATREWLKEVNARAAEDRAAAERRAAEDRAVWHSKLGIIAPSAAADGSVPRQ